MTNAQMFDLFIGWCLPFVLAMVIRRGWSSTTKTLIAALVCIPAGLGSAYATHELIALSNFDALFTNVLIVLVATHAAYLGFYKPSGVADAVNVTLPSLPFSIVRNTANDVSSNQDAPSTITNDISAAVDERPPAPSPASTS